MLQTNTGQTVTLRFCVLIKLYLSHLSAQPLVVTSPGGAAMPRFMHLLSRDRFMHVVVFLVIFCTAFYGFLRLVENLKLLRLQVGDDSLFIAEDG
jgi:hypothetical protein